MLFKWIDYDGPLFSHRYPKCFKSVMLLQPQQKSSNYRGTTARGRSFGLELSNESTHVTVVLVLEFSIETHPYLCLLVQFNFAG
jgi:hypothetical protein